MMEPSNQPQIGKSTKVLLDKLVKLARPPRTSHQLLECLDQADIETALVGYPEDFSTPLGLFALMAAHAENGPEPIPETVLLTWIQDCALHLSLEWLKRNGAISYTFPIGEKMHLNADPLVMTADFMRDLEQRHKPLHHVATFVLSNYGASRN